MNTINQLAVILSVVYVYFQSTELISNLRDEFIRTRSFVSVLVAYIITALTCPKCFAFYCALILSQDFIIASFASFILMVADQANSKFLR